jgi:hypothetical protein
MYIEYKNRFLLNILIGGLILTLFLFNWSLKNRIDRLQAIQSTLVERVDVMEKQTAVMKQRSSSFNRWSGRFKNIDKTSAIRIAFGYSPHYSSSDPWKSIIPGDGIVSSQEYVRSKGLWIDKPVRLVSREEVVALISEAERIGFLAMPSQLDCDCIDCPVLTIGVSVNNVSKEVRLQLCSFIDERFPDDSDEKRFWLYWSKLCSITGDDP